MMACKSGRGPALSAEGPERIYRIEPYEQGEGDPEAGMQYLQYGGYVGNGIPYEMFSKLIKSKDVENVLGREGENADLSYAYNVFEPRPGLKVVSGNCFTCHASRFNGEVVLGMGNSFGDFTKNRSSRIKMLNWLVKRKYGKDSPAWELYEEQAEWFKAVTPAVVMVNPGINPAFRLEEAVIAYRNPEDLTYRDEPLFDMPELSIGTDVPPLWNVRKKKVLYYNGMGRGDFTKLLMQACLLGIHDSTQAREIQQNFEDVIAWLQALEPPRYPLPVDSGLVIKGGLLFEEHCSKCHGRYGEDEFYPNKIVPLSEVGTDPVYAHYAMKSPVNDWYNRSWFVKSDPPASSRPSDGYVAPPLDGVWATAPYLHNGSVPDLASLLDSRQRPLYWSRSWEDDDYNYETVGWNYRPEKNGRGKHTFDTTLPGYGNGGHTFGDKLTEEERKAVIEFLKTL
jgi:mono/diheme cytochrome c family protein